MSVLVSDRTESKFEAITFTTVSIANTVNDL